MKTRIIKVILVGDAMVGKSAIMHRYADNQFTEYYIKTIGVDFKISNQERDNKNFKLQIWDTSGLEQYRNITTAYFRGAEYFVIVLDGSTAHDINQCISRWKELIQLNAHSEFENNIIVAVNMKQDLTPAEIELLKNQYKSLEFPYVFVNPKSDSDMGIKVLFNEIILNRVIEADAKLAKQSAAMAGQASEKKEEDEINTLLSGYLNPLKYLFTHHWKRMTAVKQALKKLPKREDRLALVDNQLDLLEGQTVAKSPFDEKIIDSRWATKVDSDSSKNFDKSGAYQTLFSMRNKLSFDPKNIRVKKVTSVEDKDSILKRSMKN